MKTETVFTDERCPGIQLRWVEGQSTFNIFESFGGGWKNTDCLTRPGDRQGQAPAPVQAQFFAERYFDHTEAEEAHHALTGE